MIYTTGIPQKEYNTFQFHCYSHHSWILCILSNKIIFTFMSEKWYLLVDWIWIVLIDNELKKVLALFVLFVNYLYWLLALLCNHLHMCVIYLLWQMCCITNSHTTVIKENSCSFRLWIITVNNQSTVLAGWGSLA